MSDRVLLSASPVNVRACIDLAAQRNLGIEMMAFAYPDVLDGDWRSLVREYQSMLAGIPLRAMHGPFFDMSPGSIDQRINALVMERYQLALDIAAELQAETVVFHANFIASLRTPQYRIGWTARNIEFFARLAPLAAERGVTIAVENMWEYEPSILTDLIHGVGHPALRACLDVGHAHLFGEVPFGDWLTALGPVLVHMHLNNNDGLSDVHRAFDDGVLDYDAILTQLRALPQPPTMTLEMDRVEDMAASLPYFE